jgi:hypothetical protein
MARRNNGKANHYGERGELVFSSEGRIEIEAGEPAGIEASGEAGSPRRLPRFSMTAYSGACSL